MITILGVISVSVAQVISLSAQIYITGAERTRLVSDARFIILRLEKELRNVVPNSVSFDSSLGCLSYYPIKESGTYVGDSFFRIVTKKARCGGYRQHPNNQYGYNKFY